MPAELQSENMGPLTDPVIGFWHLPQSDLVIQSCTAMSFVEKADKKAALQVFNVLVVYSPLTLSVERTVKKQLHVYSFEAYTYVFFLGSKFLGGRLLLPRHRVGGVRRWTWCWQTVCAYLEEEVVVVRSGVGLEDGGVAGAQLGDGGAWAWARRRRGGRSQLVRRAPHEEALGSGTAALGSGTAAWRAPSSETATLGLGLGDGVAQ